MATSPCRTEEAPLLIPILDVGGDALLPHPGLIQASRKSERLPWTRGLRSLWHPCLSTGHTPFYRCCSVWKVGVEGLPWCPAVGDPPARAADMVQSLGREDPTCLVATKPVLPNDWARALKPTGHNCWSHTPQLRSLWAYSLWSTREATAMRSQQTTMKSSLHSCN